METHFPFDQKQSFQFFYVMGLYKIVAFENRFAVLKVLKITNRLPFHFTDGKIALESVPLDQLFAVLH